MKKLLLILILISIFLNCEKIEIKQSETMAQQDLNYGTAYNDPSSDSARTTFDKVQDNFDELYAQDIATIAEIDVIQAQISTSTKEIVPIDVWNMDTDATKSISWALPSGKTIRSINVIILPDTGNGAYRLDNIEQSTFTCEGGFYYNGSAFVLARKGAGTFDSASFDGSGLRGYIMVEYDAANPV